MDLLQVVSDASDGDLRVRAKISAGALGNVADAFNHLLESLQGLIGEIESQLNLTNGAIKTIADASRQMAAGRQPPDRARCSPPPSWSKA